MIHLYNTENYEGMETELSKVDWTSIIRDNQSTTTSYESLLCMLGNLKEKYIPTKWLDGSKHINTIKLAEDEKALVRKKMRAFQQYMEIGLHSKWLNYTRLRNKVKAVQSRAQKSMKMEGAGMTKESPKVFGNYVKRKTVKHTRIPELFIDDGDHSKRMAESDKQKANILSLFYSTVFTKETSDELPELFLGTIDIHIEHNRGTGLKPTEDAECRKVLWTG